jgi:hypothetical protein
MRNKRLYFLLLVLLVVAYIFYITKTSLYEPMTDLSKNVVCFLCVCPNEIVINFAKKILKKYKVYIVCDDIYCVTPTEQDITYIKISDEECMRAGYTKSNVAIDKIPSAWDKALYYFCVKDTVAQNVWFIEEDVFIPRVSIFSDIDENYPTADLIAKQNVPQDEDPEFTWWFDADGMIDKPFYRSLVCATRVSRQLLNKVSEIVASNGRLFFIEIMFNTIATQQHMQLVMPEELSKIIWRHDWNIDDIDENHMFHPVKNTRNQKEYRTVLSAKEGSKIEAFHPGRY